MRFLQLSEGAAKLQLTDRLAAEPATLASTSAELSAQGLEIPKIAPLSAQYLEFVPNESK